MGSFPLRFVNGRSGSRRSIIVEKVPRRGFGLDHAFSVSEEDIHKAILDWLRLVLPAALIFHVPNGGSRDVREASKLKRMGVLAGVPDLLVFADGGKAIAFEVKTQIGRLSDDQRSIHDTMRRLGFSVAVVRGIDEVRASLVAWGIPTREAAR